MKGDIKYSLTSADFDFAQGVGKIHARVDIEVEGGRTFVSHITHRLNPGEMDHVVDTLRVFIQANIEGKESDVG
jgi:hypothetical protein